MERISTRYARTVGELVAVLQTLPDDLPVESYWEDILEVTHFSMHHFTRHEHAGFEDIQEHVRIIGYVGYKLDEEGAVTHGP